MEIATTRRPRIRGMEDDIVRTYVALLHEYLEEMEELTDEEFGRLCRGLLRYSATGEVFEPSGNERFFVRHVMAQEDRHQESYERISKVRSEAGKKGMASRWGITKDNKNNQTNTKTKTDTKTDTKTNSSPVLGGSAGFCVMSDAELLRQMEREGLI